MYSRYNRKEWVQSLYCYQNTEIYINRFDIQDEKSLYQVETDLAQNRLSEMMKTPLKGRFGLSHLCKIHHYIFQDIYPFAGKLRLEDIYKGNTQFCKSQHIESNLNALFIKLKDERFLGGLEKQHFVSRISYYMSELNIIHPFREGNGRVIREYVRLLALKNGIILNWEKVDGNELLEAVIKAVDFDYALLEQCISKAIEE